MESFHLGVFGLISTPPSIKVSKHFRCPYCGDSQKNKLKARGYLIHNKTFFVYKCHNCEKSTDFSNLLKYFRLIFVKIKYKNAAKQ